MHKHQHPEGLPVEQNVLLVRQEDCFLPLGALAKVAGLSVKKLRSLLADLVAPLPHFRPGAKILVKWSEFEAYMERFRASASVDVDRMVQELMEGIRRQTSPRAQPEGRKQK
jgi:hypothetical protein